MVRKYYKKSAEKVRDKAESVIHKSDELRNQASSMWHRAIEQIDDVRDTLLSTRELFAPEIERLKRERDNLLRKLGEQTLRMTNQGLVPVPDVVRRTVDMLNDTIDSIVEHESNPASYEQLYLENSCILR